MHLGAGREEHNRLTGREAPRERKQHVYLVGGVRLGHYRREVLRLVQRG